MLPDNHMLLEKDKTLLLTQLIAMDVVSLVELLGCVWLHSHVASRGDDFCGTTIQPHSSSTSFRVQTPAKHVNASAQTLYCCNTAGWVVATLE